MKMRTRYTGILATFMALLMMLSIFPTFPVQANSVIGDEITPDANTVILDHLNGATVGTPYGGLTYAPSNPNLNLAGDFGIGNFVKYHANANLRYQGTLEFWVKLRNTPVSLVNFNWGNTGSSPPAGHVMHLSIFADGRVAYSAWSSGYLNSVSALQVNTWHHLAISWGAAGTKIYIDGVLDASRPLSCGPHFYSNWVYLNYWGHNNLGLVDEFHISNIQRTDDEIASRVKPGVISATVDIDPDTLNLKSKGKWISGYIDFPSGYDVNDINISTVKLNDAIPAEWGELQNTTQMVKFDRSDVEDLISSPNDSVLLTVAGKITDGTTFEGNDTIRAIKPP